MKNLKRILNYIDLQLIINWYESLLLGDTRDGDTLEMKGVLQCLGWKIWWQNTEDF